MNSLTVNMNCSVCRMFVDALDAQMYDEHHSSGRCYLSLSKVICFCFYEFSSTDKYCFTLLYLLSVFANCRTNIATHGFLSYL